jgi:selenide,water dikinase
MKRLLLVGGGHSHVEVLRRFALRPVDGVELVLVSAGRFTPYSGMLPGLVAGHYSFEQSHIDLERLAAWGKARFLCDCVTGLDLQARRAQCEIGGALDYDLLSLDVGSTPPIADIRGAQRYGVPVKPVERLLAAWDEVLADAGRRAVHVLTVGGGAGGVELTLSMQYRARQAGARAAFCVVTDSAAILPGHSAGARRRMERALRTRDVACRVGTRVTEIDAGIARLADGGTCAADHVIWATGASAPAWLRGAGLATDRNGFALVRETLQSCSHPEVFAAGDVATIEQHPRPKSGVFAVREGPPLAENLRRALTGTRLERHVPQRVALALISTGDRHAIASWGPLAWEGGWVWRWKDRIDRGFVAKYRP